MLNAKIQHWAILIAEFSAPIHILTLTGGASTMKRIIRYRTPLYYMYTCRCAVNAIN